MLDSHVHRLDRLSGLLPTPRAKALTFIERCFNEGIILRVTEGFRTAEQQGERYARGRTLPGPIVTNAGVGWSWHEYRRAFDVCIVAWPGDTTPRDVYDGPWERIGEIAEACGLEWGGRWKWKDQPHFEDRGGMTIAMARAAGVPALPEEHLA